MFEIASLETTRLRDAMGVLVVASAIAGVAVVTAHAWGMPSLTQRFAEAAPGLHAALVGAVPATLAEALAVDLYAGFWMLGVGAAVAWMAADSLAGEARSGQAEVLWSVPASRRGYALEKLLGLVPVIVVADVVLLGAVAGTGVWTGTGLPWGRLAAVHVLSIPYLLACGGIGLVVSSRLGSPRRARLLSAGVVVGLFAWDRFTAATANPWMGWASPSRHLNPGAILVDGSIDPVGIGVLVAAVLALVVLAGRIFTRRDLPGAVPR